MDYTTTMSSNGKDGGTMKSHKVQPTHVHLDVRFLGVHEAVVGLHVAHVVRLRHAVHQVTIQLLRVTQNLGWYDRSVAAECLKLVIFDWNLCLEIRIKDEDLFLSSIFIFIMMDLVSFDY